MSERENMFWSKNRQTPSDRRPRIEPPVSSQSSKVEGAPPKASDSVTFYAGLLGVSSAPDPKVHAQNFGSAGMRNADGIPIAYEEQAESVAQVVASSYEEKYDFMKAQMKSRGLPFITAVHDDNGELFEINYAAVAAAPFVSDVTDEPELVLYCVAALHWLLASKDHEWIFSHLVEATAAYYRCQALREKLDPEYVDHFDDLRTLLKEALRHYIHRPT